MSLSLAPIHFSPHPFLRKDPNPQGAQPGNWGQPGEAAPTCFLFHFHRPSPIMSCRDGGKGAPTSLMHTPQPRAQ